MDLVSHFGQDRVGAPCGAVFVNLGSGSGETVRSSGRSSQDPNPAALGRVSGICARFMHWPVLVLGTW